MGLGKTYSTSYLADSNNNTGVDGQVLISTATGINWSDGADIIGGPYLPLAGGTMTGALFGTSAGFTQGISNNIDGLRLLNPGGGSNVTLGNSGTIGAIKITLPVSWTGTMMRMTIKVYEYTTNESFTLVCGGYNYSTSSAWLNEFSYIESSPYVDRNFTVRFGHDGTKCCIYIGELNSSWQYPKVYVTDFYAAFNNATASTWQDGWDVSMEATAFGTTTKTKANTQVNNWARNGQDTYFSSGSGNVGIGTTSPDARLEVSSTAIVSDDARYELLITEDNTASAGRGGGLAFTRQGIIYGGIKTLQNTSNNDNTSMYFQTRGGGTVSNRMTIDETGNVGIGTTSPTDYGTTANTLEVRGASGTGAGLIRVSNAGNTVGASFYSGSASSTLGTQTAHPLYLSTNNSAKMTILSGGNVGIGTTNPSARLEVDGITRVSGDFAGTGQNPLIQLYNTDTSLGANQILGDIDFYQSDPSGGGAGVVGRIRSINDSSFKGEASLTFSTGEVGVSFKEQMRIDSTGNVGIGTDSPSAKLVVIGASSNTYLSIDNAGSGENYFAANSFHAFQTSGSERMRITSGGNVGLGTTVPQTKLALGSSQGSGIDFLYDTTNNYKHQIKNYWNSNTDSRMDFNIGRTSGVTPVTIMSVGYGGNVGIGTTTPLAKLDIQGTQGQLFSVTDDLSGSIFAVADISGVPIFDVNSSGVSYFDGNVGIGTDSPASKLQVGDYMASNVLTIGGWYGGGGGTLAFKSGYVNNAAYVWDTARIKATDDGNFNGRIEFQTTASGGNSGASPTTKMVLKASGNVGIGVTSPEAKLTIGDPGGNTTRSFQIEGNNSTAGINATIGVFSDATYIGTNYYYSSGQVKPVTTHGQTAIVQAVSATPLSNYIAFNVSDHTDANSAPDTRMTIRSDGNVGIGNTSPSQLLHVGDGSDAARGIVSIEGAGGQHLIFSEQSSYYAGANAFVLTPAASTNFIVTQPGNSVPALTLTAAGALNIRSNFVTGQYKGLVFYNNVYKAITQTGATSDNTVNLGTTSGRFIALYATNGTIQTSDIREKTEIKSTQLGLDFVNDLNPVSYKWVDGKRIKGDENIKDERHHQGLIAQEVAETLEKHGVDKNEFGGLDIQKTDKYDDFHGMSYEQLVAPMIKAIQELKAEIDILKAK